jgi:hypothetical protein
VPSRSELEAVAEQLVELYFQSSNDDFRDYVFAAVQGLEGFVGQFRSVKVRTLVDFKEDTKA